jgi:pyrroline-5-carboxylate reductase
MKVAIVGVDGLGGALARGLSRSGIELALCDRHPEKLAAVDVRFATNADATTTVAGADVVLLCVKPKATVALASSLAPALLADALVVSCAAGVSTGALAAALPSHAVARAMPNVGAAAGASATGVFLGPRCDGARDRARLRTVFDAVGSTHEVLDEELLHAITAVGGSGPAFVLVVIEALIDAGIEQGLARADALAFASGALRAAAARVADGTEPAEVRAQITSPGGTTAAGLARLEERAVRAAFLDAVRSATARSRERAL